MTTQTVETLTDVQERLEELGWSIDHGTAGTVMRVLKSYDGVIADSLGVWGFLDWLKSGTLFIHEESGAWLLIDDVRPGVRFTIHGAKWNAKGKVDEPADQLISLLARVLQAKVVLSFIPDHATEASALVERLQFKHTGYIPGYDTYKGTLRGMNLYVRVMAVPEE